MKQIIFDIEIVRLDNENYDSERMDFNACHNKIICISLMGNESVGSLIGDEKEIIERFFGIIEPTTVFIGHNIKSFDIPFVVRRAVILGIKIPQRIKAYGKKPWDMDFIIDTKEVWSHTQWNGKGTLDEISQAIGIPSPKENMHGSEVNDYFLQGRLDEIKVYCEGDVIATKKVYEHFVAYNLI